MPTLTTLTRALLAVACSISIAACKTAPVAPPVPPTPKLAEFLSQATQAAGAGQKEQAVSLWKQAAKAYPADKTPWLSIAQTRYEAGLYGDAILNAQEALVRDPNDQLANSIIATSGLRLATRSLSELSRQNNLTGPLRSESQSLAKLLRETLGENNLFSDAVPVVKPAPTPSRQANRSRAAKPDVKEAKKDSADPFSALK